MRRERSRKRPRWVDWVGPLALVVGIAAMGISPLLPSWLAGWTAAAPKAVSTSYFRALAAGDLTHAESLATGEAAAALRFNTTHRQLAAVPVLALQVSQEEDGPSVALEAVSAESGGSLPTLAQDQVLLVRGSEGWRIASVWEGPGPADFGGQATADGMQATAQDWLAHEAAGDFQGALHDLAGGALSSAQQTGQSATTWAGKVKVGRAVWKVLGTDGSWGAIEGQWRASTPAGPTQVALVLVGQEIAGRWRITRVVTIG